VEISELYRLSLAHFLGPIQELLDDPTVTEVMVNGPQRIYYERGGKIFESPHAFPSEDQLLSAVVNIAEYVDRPLSQENLSMDARLPDGSRVHVILPPVARSGISLTIRKFHASGYTLDELVRIQSIKPEGAALLERAISDHKNLIVSGGTGTGKTSLLNALSQKIDPRERIVVIEESSELKLHQPHTVYLEARAESTEETQAFTVRDLFVNSLRMRPDRIIVGEVRRGEALELVQSMLSGHSGSLATLHASSPQTAAIRLETLCMMSDVQLPVYVARAQVAAAIDIIVQVTRTSNGHRRISEIAELIELDDANRYRWKTLYRDAAE
jgi:pilus assembly protein CpaF